MDSPMKPWIQMERYYIVTCGQDGGSGSTEVYSNLYTDINVAREAFMDAVCRWHETYSTSAVLYEFIPQFGTGSMISIKEAVVLDDGTLVVWQSLGESKTPDAEERERLVEAGIDPDDVHLPHSY